VTAAVVLSALVAVAQPSGGDRYYVLLFGGQGDLLRPRTAHTWATFVRTTPAADGTTTVEAHTISWLPATLKIRPFALMAEKGVNLTLDQTLDFIDSHPRTRVAVWGPYEIPVERFEQALRQKELLESGSIRYHSLGLLGRKQDVMHCIDGVTRTDPTWERAANPSRWFGEGGTSQAVRAGVRSGFIPSPAKTDEWLIPEVNTGGHALVHRRTYLNPIRER
jgi:hypothetical protein